ncbi:cytoskeleton-associated protein 2-like [Austrofundulus limnaeus]|uniref:Cytoskeleton-associated protein 2-like n=1 Tax=Austrofundulus limnaeus TaxID=52670 RepID=A0A2I4AHH4_AUSLI|nr:PREDICTED: cytoskeleton-associated protein 2-like [Austrofundulus limnaeus]
MEEAESAPMLSRKELRKQKLMEYLAAKGKLKPTSVPSLQNCLRQVVTGKENKSSADKFKDSKGPTLIAQSSQNPVRSAFGVSNTVNVRGGTQKGKENTVRSSSSIAPPQPKPYQNPLLRKTYTVVVSKPNATAAGTLKKPTIVRGHASGQASSAAASTAGAKSSFQCNLNSNCTTAQTAGSRISMGPLVKTKTGLTPAVIQPRNTKSDLPRPSAASRKTISTASVVRKVQACSTASASLRQKPALNSTAGAKVQPQNKSNPKPTLDKQTLPACKSQHSGGLRVTSASFKAKAPPARPEGRALTSMSIKVTSGAAPQAASRTNTSSSTTGSRLKPTVVTQPAGKTKTNKETSSANVLPPRAPPKCAVAPILSQTEPQPSRSVSITGRAAVTKTPKVTAKVPQTEGKKTTAQEERLKKLKEWREAKGISYKRPPMPVKTPVRRAVSVAQPFWVSMKAEEDARSLIQAVDRTLADCIKLLAEGCPPDQVRQIFSRLPPLSQKFAKYWICRARLMEREGDLDVLPMFEEAVRVVLEPVDELRSVVFDILKKKDEIQENENQEHISSAENTPDGIINPLLTPKPVRALINGEKGDSSVVKYKITKTPGGPPSQHRQPVRVNGYEVRFFTPVRRSVRIERASLHYPASLQDHDVCVASYSDLIAEENNETSDERKSGEDIPPANDATMYVYRENEALGDKVSVQLVYDDPV